MFGTTKEFLYYFGLKKLDDLPPLSEIKDLDSLNVELELPEPSPQTDLLDEMNEEDLQASIGEAATDEPVPIDDSDGGVISFPRPETG